MVRECRPSGMLARPVAGWVVLGREKYRPFRWRAGWVPAERNAGPHRGGVPSGHYFLGIAGNSFSSSFLSNS
jgi:hypothetical protein